MGANAPSAWSAAELGAFFVRNRSEFLAHAKRVTRTPAEAEELVQDALVRVLLACPELDGSDHALSYFHRVIENLSFDLHRRERRFPRLVVLDEASSELEARWIMSPDFSEQIAAADDAAIVREAISLLSAAERAALVMWEFEGRSAAEIAGELGIKESAVRHTLVRARAKLRRILSERIIDEARGLTALDVLSVAYRKTEAAVKKSSKISFSLVLVVAAFLGFTNQSWTEVVSSESVSTDVRLYEEDATSSVSPSLPTDEASRKSSESSAGITVDDRAVTVDKAAQPSFLASGVDAGVVIESDERVPSGFSVADSLGSVGTLFSGKQQSISTETGLLLSNIVSTKSGATNVLINQTIVLDSFGTSYVAQVSVGIKGEWTPLRLSYISSSIVRLTSGEYLLTGVMKVNSAIETIVRLPTPGTGADLSAAPDFVSTRALLSVTKTEILAQEVFVSANSQKDGA